MASPRPAGSRLVPLLSLIVLASGMTPARGERTIGGIEVGRLHDFADRLHAAVAVGDVEAANACIDWSRLIDTALEGLIADPDDAAKFVRGFKIGAAENRGGPNDLMHQVASEAEGVEKGYELVRLHEVEGQPRALFRLAGDGVNYHDYVLARRGDEIVAIDLYIYSMGERFSQTLRRLALPMTKQLQRSWLSRLMSSDRAILDNYKLVAEYNELVRLGKAHEAMAIYDRLPASLQSTKAVLINRYHAALLIDEETVIEATESFEAAHPGDPALLLLSIDALLYQGRFNETLEAVDKLDAAVGGDWYLNLFRVSVELTRGDLAEAARYCRLLVAGDPDHVEHRWMLLGVLLQGDDHAATYEALATMEARSGFEGGDLRESPEYAGFVASPQGQRWLREHGFIDHAAPHDQRPFAPTDETPDELFHWSDTGGRFSVEARFVGFNPATRSVELEKTNGKVIAVPIDRLSDESRARARRLHEQRRATTEPL